jgi:hypothetical protein
VILRAATAPPSASPKRRRTSGVVSVGVCAF